MKIIALYFILVLAMTLLCTSCNWFPYWNEEQVTTELEKLPPATQTGEFTFGCLVNGNAFVVTNSLTMTAIYQRGNLQIGGEIENSDTDKAMTFFLGDPLIIGKKYELSHKARYIEGNLSNYCLYEFEDTFEGWILFSKIDRTKFIISGTFEFSTANDDCDTVYITDGRFDMKYTP